MDDPRTKITIPAEIGRVIGPDREMAKQLRDMEQRTICGGRVDMVWQDGPKKGLAITGYCQKPVCMITGECPAPYFVPHSPQYTHLDQTDPACKRRSIDMKEAIAAVREFSRIAAMKGARPEKRTDRQIAKHVATVWTKLAAALKGKGDWLTS